MVHCIEVVHHPEVPDFKSIFLLVHIFIVFSLGNKYAINMYTSLCMDKSFHFSQVNTEEWNTWIVHSDGKESACNAGYLGSIPGSGRSPREGNGNPL